MTQALPAQEFYLEALQGTPPAPPRKEERST